MASLITHVRHVGIAVEDLAEATAFYEGVWQLDPVADDSGLRFYGAGSPEQYVLRVRQADRPGTDLLAFGVATMADVDTLARDIEGRGIRLVSEPAKLDTPGVGYGFRFFDPDGRVIEISADVEARAFREVEEGEGRPRRLSHVVVNTDDVERMKTFYEDVLGFRLSDWLEDYMCFLRCQSDHHAIALFKAPHPSLNHVSFEMLGIDEFMRGAGRLVRSGRTPIWGPGRHGAGNNTFCYFTDPQGFVMEYTTELQKIDEERGWCPKVWRATPEQSDLWGTAGPLTGEAVEALLGAPDPSLWSAPPV